MTKFRAARIYDDASQSDGYRVLVDRIWPRGVRKTDAKVDDWPKEIAPSTELRKRFHADDDFKSFARDYKAELDENESAADILDGMREHDTVTLLTAAKHPEHSHVQVLLDRLRG